MSEGELTRVKDDLSIMQRAMGLYVPFGTGMLVVGILLTISALAAAAVSLFVEDDRLQVAPFAVILVIGMIGTYLQSRRNVNFSPEITMQIAVSVSIYCIVWVAACGYVLATVVGPAVGAARTAALLWLQHRPPSCLLVDAGSLGPEKPRAVLLSRPRCLAPARRDAAPNRPPALQLPPGELLRGRGLPDGRCNPVGPTAEGGNVPCGRLISTALIPPFTAPCGWVC